MPHGILRDMKPSILPRVARWKLVMVVCGLALLAAGCGSGSGTSSGSTSSTATSSHDSFPGGLTVEFGSVH